MISKPPVVKCSLKTSSSASKRENVSSINSSEIGELKMDMTTAGVGDLASNAVSRGSSYCVVRISQPLQCEKASRREMHFNSISNQVAGRP